MAEPKQKSGLDELSYERCIELLGAHDVGRLAVVVDGQPVIFPVNYATDDETVVLRTDAGTKRAHSSLDRVAFEVDELDFEKREGWSVVVQGTGREFTEALDDVSVSERGLSISTWVPGEKAHWSGSRTRGSAAGASSAGATPSRANGRGSRGRSIDRSALWTERM
jgi:hypothetical protein